MKHVLITGGSRGIGASAALHCAQRGMGVILTRITFIDPTTPTSR